MFGVMRAVGGLLRALVSGVEALMILKEVGWGIIKELGSGLNGEQHFFSLGVGF